MKRVLLTGATGFIGRHCLSLLTAKGYEVHAVSTKSAPVDEPEVSYHRADLLDGGQVEELIAKLQPTHLLHFAWYVAHGKYWTAPENLRWVQASLDLLQAFALQGGRRVVMAGTCAEYDWKYGYCSEHTTPLSPATLYGICKHSLQSMLGAFAKQTGLSAAWGRIFFVYGPHEHPNRLVPTAISSLLQGRPALCSRGNQVRDFLHVQDVADAFVSLLESEVTAAVNIASGYPVVLKDVINHIAKRIGRPELVRLGAIPTASDDPALLVAECKRLKEEVGWSPSYELNYGLEQTIDWWSQQLGCETR